MFSKGDLVKVVRVDKSLTDHEPYINRLTEVLESGQILEILEDDLEIEDSDGWSITNLDGLRPVPTTWLEIVYVQ